MAYTPQKKHAPIDDSVNLPAAIRAASMRSDALHAQAYQEETQQEKPADAQPATPEVVQPNAEHQPTQTQEETAPAEPPKATPSAATTGEEDWQHKYNSLKGRYDRQEEVIRGLNRTADELRAAVARLEAKPPVQQPTPDLKFDLTPEERETYGDDFIDVASRAAASKFMPIINGLQREVQELRGNVGHVQEVSQEEARRRLYAHLDEQQPNWRDINRDPHFIAWANLPDPYSGVIRLSMMQNAFEKGDAQRVLRFFKGFLSDEAATDPARRVQPNDLNKGKVPLETLAAPGRAKAPAASEAPGEKETISRRQISAFYADVQKGRYRGNEEEKNRLERMIFEAEAEGRITD